MSGVSLVDEYRHARDALVLTRGQLIAVARSGFEHAFVDGPARTELLATFDAKVAGLG
jgi:adenosine deaminase